MPRNHHPDVLLPHERHLLCKISSGEFNERELQEALWEFRQPLLVDLWTTHYPGPWFAKELRVEKTSRFPGRIDLLGQSADSGKLLICELKKGPITPDALVQIEAYARALEWIAAPDLAWQIAAQTSKSGQERIRLLNDLNKSISDARTEAREEIASGDAHAKSSLCIVIGKSWDVDVKDSARDRRIALFLTAHIEARACSMLRKDETLRRSPAQPALSTSHVEESHL